MLYETIPECCSLIRSKTLTPVFRNGLFNRCTFSTKNELFQRFKGECCFFFKSKEVGEEIQEIEERLDINIKDIHNAQRLLHQNQLEFSQNLTAFTEMVQKVGEAVAAVRETADTVKDITEVLSDVVRSVTKAFLDQQRVEIVEEMEVA